MYVYFLQKRSRVDISITGGGGLKSGFVLGLVGSQNQPRNKTIIILWHEIGFCDDQGSPWEFCTQSKNAKRILFEQSDNQAHYC